MIADTPPAADATRDDRLDEVLASYLRALRDGAAPDRDELLARHPDLAPDLLEFFADQDRFDRAAAPLRAAVGAPARLPPEVGPYQILGEIARGGMGVVLRARHRNLGRVVALKLMLSGSFAGPAERARFRREAEAVAGLDHPNIVPVYEVGEAVTGPGEPSPYFTMKLLDDSLAGSLARGEWGPGAADAPRRAAGLLAAVARAVHHAHQRGVLHRDLKPGNILLQMGDGGWGMGNERPGATAASSRSPSPIPHPPLTPMVADFGLARRASGEGGGTETGAVVGTPSYMAPEQAAGKAREVTVASDVWSLGAVLYELLTGRPPYKGETPLETVRQVLDSAPPPPRSLARRLDADLETICLKCLERDPARRYASAAALADDLERYLARRPIRARPVGTAARAWRWARRQPVIAGLSAALAGAVVVGFTAVVILWQSALAARADAEEQRVVAEGQRDEARAALAAADRARDEARAAAHHAAAAARQADASFRQAHRAVNTFCTTVSDELSGSPQWHALRQKLLRSAREYYAVFLKERGSDPTLRRELADMHFSSALVHSSFGNAPAAIADYREAEALYRALLAAAPGDAALQQALADTLSNRATHEELSDALKTTAAALALYDRFLAGRPDDVQLAAGRARTLTNLGASLSIAGQMDRARAAFEEAMSAQVALAAREPWRGSFRGSLAATLHNLGVLLERRGEYPESLCCYLRSLDLREELARASPADDARQADVATMQFHVGVALEGVGEYGQAAHAYNQALDGRRQLAERFPQVVRYQFEYGASLRGLGIWQEKSKRPELALKSLHQAREIYERLLEKAPGSPGVRGALARVWVSIAVCHRVLKQRGEEGDALRRARQLQEALVRQSPENAELRVDLGWTLQGLGVNLWVRGQGREAKEVLRQAVESSKLLLGQAPEVQTHRRLLHHHYGMLAEIEWRQGNARASVDWVRPREALWPGNGWELYRSGAEYARAAALLGDDPEAMAPGVRKEYLGYLELSLRALGAAARAGFADAAGVVKDADLKPLHGRADFERVLEDMRGRARPAKKQ